MMRFQLDFDYWRFQLLTNTLWHLSVKRRALAVILSGQAKRPRIMVWVRGGIWSGYMMLDSIRGGRLTCN